MSNYDISTTEGMTRAAAWMETAIIDSIREGGLWQVPRSGCAFMIKHSEKVFMSVGEDHEKEPAIVKVIEHLGWKVERYVRHTPEATQ